MPNPNARYSYEHWREIELLGNDLATVTFEMNERIGSGGGAVSPDELINAALRAEAILARLKVVANKYS